MTKTPSLTLAPAVVAAMLLAPRPAMAQRPVHLLTQLIEHTDRVYMGGRLTTMTLADVGGAVEPWQVAEIRSARPHLAWAYESPEPESMVESYAIGVATSARLATADSADVWRSGTVMERGAAAATYGGPDLKPSTTYYWTVTTTDNHGHRATSAVKAFRTAATMGAMPAQYPLTLTDERPIAIDDIGPQAMLLDFGNDAFGQLSLTISTTALTDTLTIHLGEQLANGRVNRHPEGSQRYARYRLPLMRGTHTYQVKMRKDRRNTTPRQNESGVDPVLMPPYIGEVMPFRYCEIEGMGSHVVATGVVRHVAAHPFDSEAAHFESSDSVLNMVWELCKHTVRATSFCGTYVDGDRERIPYEADAIINQLSHYAVDREWSMARHSVHHLVYSPTWPTEWQLQSVIMAWNDYLYTGDTLLMASAYHDLKAKTLLALRDDNGLISTRTGRCTKDFLKSIHFKGKQIRDIVDWPQTGAEGLEKEASGEADGFVFTDYNTVVNAYHHEALRLMALMAKALGHQADATHYAAEAERVRTAFNTLLLDTNRGIYRDGIGTNHCSLHANMFALCFGLVPQELRQSVTDYVKSRGMACSVYGAQFLLDALYDAGEASHALSLLNSTAMRSWYNMLRIGSTITTEAWDNAFKPNQDWNHPWGAAPANIIARKLMGVEPTTPGFATMRIKPQPASLAHASLTMPTIRGNVEVAFDNHPGSSFELTVSIPANTTAEVWMPRLSTRCIVDGTPKRGKRQGQWTIFLLGSGTHTLKAGQ